MNAPDHAETPDPNGAAHSPNVEPGYNFIVDDEEVFVRPRVNGVSTGSQGQVRGPLLRQEGCR